MQVDGIRRSWRKVRLWWTVPNAVWFFCSVFPGVVFLLVVWASIPPLFFFLCLIPILFLAVTAVQRSYLVPCALAILLGLMAILLEPEATRTIELLTLAVAGPVALGFAEMLFRICSKRRKAEESLRQEKKERCLAEANLARTRARLELALTGSGLGMYTVNLKTGHMDLDDRARFFLGRLPEESIRDQDWLDHIHPDDRERTKASMQVMLRGDVPLREIEYRLQREGGNWIWLFDSGRIVGRDLSGQPIRFSGTLLDITARKEAEAELAKRKEPVLFFGALLRDSYQPFVVAYEDGRLDQCNPAYCRLLGYSSEEMTDWNWIRATPPEWQPLEEERLAELRATGEPQRYEKEYWRKDGSRISVELVVHWTEDRGTGTRAYYAFVIDISQRKQTEETLRHQEETYRTLYEDAPIGIYRTTPEGRFLMANSALVAMAGFSTFEELASLDLEHGEVEPHGQRREFKRQVEAEGGVMGYEEVWNRPDGSHIHVRQNARAIRGSDGRILYYEGTAEDVSERKRVEEALRHQNAYLLALQKTALGLLNRLELRDVLQEIVNRAGELLGTPHGYLFLTLPDNGGLKMKNASGRVRGYLDIVFQSGEGLSGKVFQSGQSMLVHEFGTWAGRSRKIPTFRDQTVIGVPLRSGKERVIGVLGLSFEDGQNVGEEEVKSLEQFSALASIAVDNAFLYAASQNELRTRQRTEEALRESETKLRTLIESSGDGVVLTDERGFVIEWNRSQERITGISREEALGRLIWVVQPELAEGKNGTEREPGSLLRQELKEALVCGKAPTLGHLTEAPFQRSNGSSGTLQSMYFSVPTAKGYRIGSVSRDVSEQREVQQAIEKARSDLLFAVSHEMKTPLMTLAASRELLRGLPAETSQAKQEEYDEMWQQNLRRLRTMVDNLVDSQRVQTTGLKLQREEVDLAELIRQSVAELQPLAESHQISIDLRAKEPLQANVDAEAVQRMTGNLLTNAIKFSYRHGTVRVELQRIGQEAVLSVHDQGMGIPPEELPFLFQPFSRTGQAIQRGVPGTGLGLYVAKLLAEAHGGRIELVSQPGQGVVATIRLPLEETSPSSKEPIPLPDPDSSRNDPS